MRYNNTTTRYNEVSTFTWYHVSRYHSYLFVKKFQNRSSYIFLPFPTINPSTYIQKLKKILASNLKTQVSMTLHQSRKCHSIEYPNFNDRSSTSLNWSVKQGWTTSWNDYHSGTNKHRVARVAKYLWSKLRGASSREIRRNWPRSKARLHDSPSVETMKVNAREAAQCPPRRRGED